MPSSPKISKQVMLETAFEMLKTDGYSAINIKTLAAKLGSSTQPISRHFGSMDGLRNELLDYCIGYLETVFSMRGETASEILYGIALGYIDLAFDNPNLYKYFYMSEEDGQRMGTIARSLRFNNFQKIVEMLAQEEGITARAANDYMNNLTFYVHGIASYVAVEFVDTPKEEIMRQIKGVSESLLALAKNTK